MSSFTAADQPRSLERAQADRIEALEKRLHMIQRIAQQLDRQDPMFGVIAALAQRMLERRL